MVFKKQQSYHNGKGDKFIPEFRTGTFIVFISFEMPFIMDKQIC